MVLIFPNVTFAYDRYLGGGLHPYTPSISISNYLNGFSLMGTTTANLVEGTYNSSGFCQYSFNTSTSGSWSANAVAYIDTGCSGVAMTGTYYLYFFGNYLGSNNWNSIQGYDALINGNLASVSTRIDTVNPYNEQLLSTSTTNTIGSIGVISSSDFNGYSELDIHLENSAKGFQQCADVICSELQSGAVSRDFVYPLTTASPYFYSSTTTGLPVGKYYMTTKIRTGSYCIFGFCALMDTLVSTSTSFIIGTSTKADILKTSVIDYLNNLQSTTTSSFANCGIGDFNLFLCGQDLITYAFVPTPDAISYIGTQLHDNILTHFPIGYITDFISIIATTTEGSLTVIDATIPNGVVGTGSHIHLDLAHQLDYILNATTSSFVNSSASSTQTFYEITSYYWKIIVYVLTLFYILGRIIGSSIVPNGFGSKGSLSDNSTSDDSYALKEWLYKNRKK
jgi:hypothetical protein